MTVATPRIRVLPASPARWPDVERLFGPRGAYGGCWCMFFRLRRSDYARATGAPNRRALRGLVTRGEEPGVLAYAGSEPVGWCAVAPRPEYAALARSRLFPERPGRATWSVTCFFVAKAWRRRGVTRALLEGAARLARRRGGEVLEGYAVAPRKDAPDPYVYQGLLSAYLKAGFTVVDRPSPTRARVERVLRRKAGGAPAGSSRPVREAPASPRRSGESPRG